jgi:hypothetical protein
VEEFDLGLHMKHVSLQAQALEEFGGFSGVGGILAATD